MQQRWSMMRWTPCTSTISALSVGRQIAMAGQDVAISAVEIVYACLRSARQRSPLKQRSRTPPPVDHRVGATIRGIGRYASELNSICEHYHSVDEECASIRSALPHKTYDTTILVGGLHLKPPFMFWPFLGTGSLTVWLLGGAHTNTI